MKNPRENRRALESAMLAASADASELKIIAQTHKQDRVQAASASILDRAEKRHAELRATLAEGAARAHAEMVFSFPANVQRRAVLSDTNAPARAAALADLLRAAPIGELVAMAENARRTRDDILAHSLRGVGATRADLTSEEVAPVIATLNEWHATAHASAIDDLLGAQFLVFRTEAMGALGEPYGLLFRDPAASLGAFRQACSYIDPHGKSVTVREDDARDSLVRAGVVDATASEDDGAGRHSETLKALAFA